MSNEFKMEETVNDEMVIQRGSQFQVAREVLPLDQLMKTAEMLSQSTIIPVQYQNRPENVFIALDLASRMGVSAFTLMQNLYIIQGKPSFSGQAIASMVRSNPEFKQVELVYVGEEGTDSYGAYVQAIRRSTGKILKGGTVTIGISKKEGWYQKNGSKWQTMPTQMLAYRAYTWFGRVYSPEVMMGLQSSDEVVDVEVTVSEVEDPFK